MFAIKKMGFQVVIANASLVLCFSPSCKALYSQTPTCLSVVLGHLLHLILIHPFVSSHPGLFWDLIWYFSVQGFQRIAHLYHPQAQTFYPLRRLFWSLRQQLALQAWEQGKCTDSSQQGLCHGFKLCGCHAFLIALAVLLWIKSSRVEKAVSGTWRLTSSLVLPPWFSSACPASPSLSQPSDHPPFPPIPTKGPGCKCWRGRLRLGASEGLYTGNHHAQRTVTPKSKWKPPWQLREILMRKKGKSLLTAF